MNEFQDFAYALQLSLKDITQAKINIFNQENDAKYAVQLLEKDEKDYLASIELASQLEQLERNGRGFEGNSLKKPRSKSPNLETDSEYEFKRNPDEIQGCSKNLFQVHNTYLADTLSDSEYECMASSSKTNVPLIPIETKECNGCLEQKPGTLCLECKHNYCYTCIRQLCVVALSDKRFIPVRCCKIPLSAIIVSEHFTELEYVKYNLFVEALNTPRINVVELDMAMSGLINKENLKVCFKCGAVVQRYSGCVHITCICGYEFCYTCMGIWTKNKKRMCKCDLYPRIEINKILGERVDPRQPVENLQVNQRRNYYDHVHDWVREERSNVCSQCDWVMVSYSMTCQECSQIRCRRCTFSL